MKLSDLALANVEELANNEGGFEIVCNGKRALLVVDVGTCMMNVEKGGLFVLIIVDSLVV